MTLASFRPPKGWVMLTVPDLPDHTYPDLHVEAPMCVPAASVVGVRPTIDEGTRIVTMDGRELDPGESAVLVYVAGREMPFTTCRRSPDGIVEFAAWWHGQNNERLARHIGDTTSDKLSASHFIDWERQVSKWWDADLAAKGEADAERLVAAISRAAGGVVVHGGGTGPGR